MYFRLYFFGGFGPPLEALTRNAKNRTYLKGEGTFLSDNHLVSLVIENGRITKKLLTPNCSFFAAKVLVFPFILSYIK